MLIILPHAFATYTPEKNGSYFLVLLLHNAASPPINKGMIRENGINKPLKTNTGLHESCFKMSPTTTPYPNTLRSTVVTCNNKALA